MIKLDSSIQDFLDMVNQLPRQPRDVREKGIYFLFKDNQLLYVGKTNAGILRVNSHNDKDFDSYSFLKLDNLTEKEILDLETVLIALLDPPLNLQFLPKGLDMMKNVIANLKKIQL